MAAQDRWSTRNYDLAKGAVLLVLVLLLALVLVLSPPSGPPFGTASHLPGTQVPGGQVWGAGRAGGQAVPILDPPQTTADGGVSLSGSAEPGSTVELWAGSTGAGTLAEGTGAGTFEVKLVAVPVDGDGSWSYTGQLDPGDYTVVARTVSAEGEVLNESQAVVLQVSAATPEASVAVVRIESPKVEPGGGFSLSGGAEPGMTVELWAGSTGAGTLSTGAGTFEVKLATVPVDGDGNWSYAGRLDPGDYVLVARTVSADGRVLNESETMPVSVVGTAAVTVKTPQVAASGRVVVSGTGEPGSTLEVVDNGVVVASVVVSDDGTWTVRYAASSGEHTVTVKIQGQAGEGSAVAPVAVTVPPSPEGAAVSTGAGTLDGHSYVVKGGDWLMQLARRNYGDPRRWIDIYNATNSKAAQDPSYHRIGNPNWLMPGWKIWIPKP